MKLVSFTSSDETTGIGVLIGNGSEVVDLAADRGLPTTMREFVALGQAGIEAAKAVVDNQSSTVVDAKLGPPLRPRNNVMAIGKNYHEHAAEFAKSGFDDSHKTTIPEHPIVFTKALSSIVGPGDAIKLASDPTGTTDYEGELGVVIGHGGMNISVDDAMSHVYGYTVINDVTARAVQKQHIQFFIGKSGATFCPMGPAIVTADEINDIREVWLRTTVNGEVRQEQQIKDLIFDIPTIIAAISSTVLLEPGDVIATGTPVGVGIGFDPPRFLQPGDTVTVAIEGVGELTNPVTA